MGRPARKTVLSSEQFLPYSDSATRGGWDRGLCLLAAPRSRGDERARQPGAHLNLLDREAAAGTEDRRLAGLVECRGAPEEVPAVQGRVDAHRLHVTVAEQVVVHA